MLYCKNLTVKRNDIEVISNLSFKVSAGSVLIIKGHNGAGKTTLLKTIAGLRKPDSGSITWNGDPLSDEYKESLEYIGHKNAMKDELTVEENLNFWAELSDSKEAVSAAIAYFDLIEVYNVLFRNLSEGQKRRVALAKLLCCPSQIWLLDEPTTNLDKEGIELFNNLVKTRKEQGGVIIIASHNSLKEVQNSKEVKVLNL